MRIFLSWSKEESKKYATIFKTELNILFPKAELFLSDQDISMGSNSISEIFKNLSKVDYGLIFITSSNKNEAWLNFEAGAISNSIGENKVIPIAFSGIKIGELISPIANFQGFDFAEDKFKKAMRDINESFEEPMSSNTFERLLGTSWENITSEVIEVQKNDRGEVEESPIIEKLNFIASEILKLSKDSGNLRIYKPNEIKELFIKFDEYIRTEKELFSNHIAPYILEDKNIDIQLFNSLKDFIIENIKFKSNGIEEKFYLVIIISLFFEYCILKDKFNDLDLYTNDIEDEFF